MGFGTNEKGSGGLLDQAGKSYEYHSSGQWTGLDGTRGSLIPESLFVPGESWPHTWPQALRLWAAFSDHSG